MTDIDKLLGLVQGSQNPRLTVDVMIAVFGLAIDHTVTTNEVEKIVADLKRRLTA